MLVECAKCGAPLDVKPSAKTTKCNYCRATNERASQKTLSEETPSGWRPPKVWTPPPEKGLGEVDLKYARRVTARLLGMLFIGWLVTCCGCAAVMNWIEGDEDGSDAPIMSGPFFDSWWWRGQHPLVCGGEQELTFEGVTVDLPGETAIIASGGCNLTLIDCDITAEQGIETRGGASVVVRGGSITGRSWAIRQMGPSHIEVHGTRLEGGTSGRVIGVE